jgi:hypothetical protein
MSVPHSNTNVSAWRIKPPYSWLAALLSMDDEKMYKLFTQDSERELL